MGIFNYYPDKLNTCLSTRNRTKLVHYLQRKPFK